MGSDATTLVAARRSEEGQGRAAAPWIGIAASWLTVLLGGSCGLLVVAPPLVSFVIAIAAAVGWCIWLDTNPEATS